MHLYPSPLPLSRQPLTYTAGLIRRRPRQIGSPWRELGCGRHVLLVLAYLRKGETFAELDAGSASENRPAQQAIGGRRTASR